MPAYLKRILLVGLVLIILSIIIVLILRERKFRDLEPLVGPQLKSLVNAGSDGLYILSYDSIKVDFQHSSLYLKNLRVTPDSAVLKKKEKNDELGNDIFLLQIAALKIDNININDLVRGRGINLSVLQIDTPLIRFFHKTRRSGIDRVDDTDNELTLYQKIRKKAKEVHVKEINLNKVTFIYTNQNKQKVTAIKNVDLHFGELNIDASTQEERSRFFYAKQASISMDTFTYQTGDSLYYIQWNKIKVQAAEQTMQVEGFHYHPRKRKDITTALSGKNQYDIQLQNLFLKNIDWWALAWEEGLHADSVFLNKGSIQIYNNKADNIRKNKKGFYPHQLLQSADMPINIKNLLMDSLDFIYEEYNEKNKRSAAIQLNNIHGKGNNIRNLHDTRVQSGRYMELIVDADFMKISPFHMGLYFDLQHIDNGDFKANISLKNVDVSKLNNMTKNLGLFEVNSFYVNELTSDITGDNNSATAKLKFNYRDLNVNLLKIDKATGQFKKRKFFNTILRKLVLPNSDAKQNAITTSTYKRTINQSFFGLIWRAMLEAITAAVKK
jgi:hypothetical protein